MTNRRLTTQELATPRPNGTGSAADGATPDPFPLRGLTLLLAGWYAVIFGALLSPADPAERTWFWLGAMFVVAPVAFVVAER